MEIQQVQQWLPKQPPVGHFYRYVYVSRQEVCHYAPVSIYTGVYGLVFKKYFFKEGVVIIDNYNPCVKWVDMRLIVNPDNNHPSFFQNGGKYLPFDEWELFDLNYHLLKVHMHNM